MSQVKTRVTLDATTITFNPIFELPDKFADAEVVLGPGKPFTYSPSRALVGDLVKRSEAKEAGDCHEYFLPWAPKTESKTVE